MRFPVKRVPTSIYLDFKKLVKKQFEKKKNFFLFFKKIKNTKFLIKVFIYLRIILIWYLTILSHIRIYDPPPPSPDLLNLLRPMSNRRSTFAFLNPSWHYTHADDGFPLDTHRIPPRANFKKPACAHTYTHDATQLFICSDIYRALRGAQVGNLVPCHATIMQQQNREWVYCSCNTHSNSRITIVYVFVYTYINCVRMNTIMMSVSARAKERGSVTRGSTICTRTQVAITE